MTKLDWALELAAIGFYVFRLKPDSKVPAAKGWQQEATRDPAQIMAMFSTGDYNIGIYTGKFMKDKSLLAIDEDNKGEKKGADTLFQLDFKGNEIPHTRVQTTPTGGRHHIYSCPRAVKQGVNVLGDGLDIRSRGGYIVGAGSTISGRPYTIDAVAIADAPDWLFAKLALPTPKERKEVDVSKINPDRARERALRYLEDAPIAEEGSRNDTAFRVVCELKDRGVNQDVCLELATEWNDANEPPLDVEEIEIIVGSAYKTGQNAVGVKAPETLFKAIADPVVEEQLDWFEKLNESFALVMAGGAHHILWEMEDYEGNYKLEHLNEPSFHKMLAYRTVEVNGKRQPETKLWINDKAARRYNGIVFAPEQKVSKKFFNLWRGFTVKPMQPGEVANERAKNALAAYLDHAKNNVCNGDEKLYHWMMCRWASIFQTPWDKKLTAMVFKGSKGVGKNALVKYVAALLGDHALLASKKRYLVGQFNSHFESCLLFILDEAVWGGDKDAEGGQKDLITGDKHVIERKGMEPYTVKNLTNVVTIGNEAWLVPASSDERRYAVFEVNENRKQDTEFFEEMRHGMNEGGLRLLLTFFLEYDMKGCNVNVAPQTTGLIDQKIASLDLQGQWWYDCLSCGELLGAPDGSVVNFSAIPVNLYRVAFEKYTKSRHANTRLPADIALGRERVKHAPSIARKKVHGEGYEYRSRGLAALRKDFETYLKGKIEWPPIETEESDPFI